MSLAAGSLNRRLDRAEASVAARTASRHAELIRQRYWTDPVGYMRDVLHIEPTADQERISRLLLTPPHRVLVKAGHSVGKSHVCAALVSWFYDTRTSESACITTAPTSRDVKDVLWAEIRRQRNAAGLASNFVGTQAPEMRTGHDHFAKGFTAAIGESFQGRHYRHMMFAFDESVGIASTFWTTTHSMFKAGGNHFYLAACNPTDTGSQTYIEEHAVDLAGNPKWHIVTLDAREHPNVLAGLAGQPEPYPAAVDLAQVDDWVADWCEPVLEGEVDAGLGDFVWRPGSGKWWRPGPMFEARVMGLWPRQGTYGVWSEIAWQRCLVSAPWHPPGDETAVIGCDLASHGDDYTSIHTRWGTHAMAHERHNGWLEDATAGRLKQLCAEWAKRWDALHVPRGRPPCDPRTIPVHYDADGRGGSLASHRDGYNWIGIHASGTARAETKYPNRRSELWFATVGLARKGLVNLSRLDGATLARLRQEALAPTWKPNSSGQCEVERKADTKKRLKRSPDDLDSLNLSWLTPVPWECPSSEPSGPLPPAEPTVRYGGDQGEGEKPAKRRLYGSA